MSLARRVERVALALDRRGCPEPHVRIHVICIARDGTETADPEPDSCPACGGELDVLRVEITAVPDRARTA